MAFHTHPGLIQYKALQALPSDQPLDLLVQLRLRVEAIYPDGEIRSPAETYALFNREVFGVLHRAGAHVLWRARPTLALVGPEQDRWDECFIRRFPSVEVYRSVLGDTEYTTANVHWDACVEDCRVTCLSVLSAAGI